MQKGSAKAGEYVEESAIISTLSTYVEGSNRRLVVEINRGYDYGLIQPFSSNR